MNDWDYQALSRIMNLDLLHTFAAKKSAKKVQPESLEFTSGYSWNGNKEDLIELSHCLKDARVIKSTQEFQSLFSDKGKRLVRFDKCWFYLEDYAERLIETEPSSRREHKIACHSVSRQ